MDREICERLFFFALFPISILVFPNNVALNSSFRRVFFKSRTAHNIIMLYYKKYTIYIYIAYTHTSYIYSLYNNIYDTLLAAAVPIYNIMHKTTRSAYLIAIKFPRIIKKKK